MWKPRYLITFNIQGLYFLIIIFPVLQKRYTKWSALKYSSFSVSFYTIHCVMYMLTSPGALTVMKDKPYCIFLLNGCVQITFMRSHFWLATFLFSLSGPNMRTRFMSELFLDSMGDIKDEATSSNWNSRNIDCHDVYLCRNRSIQ